MLFFFSFSRYGGSKLSVPKKKKKRAGASFENTAMCASGPLTTGKQIKRRSRWELGKGPRQQLRPLQRFHSSPLAISPVRSVLSVLFDGSPLRLSGGGGRPPGLPLTSAVLLAGSEEDRDVIDRSRRGAPIAESGAGGISQSHHKLESRYSWFLLPALTNERSGC